MENTSGQGSRAVVPREVRGWNWGAFFLTWIWGIGNSVWLALVALVPLAGFVMTIVTWIRADEWEIGYDLWIVLPLMPFLGCIAAIVLGIKGNKWAWQNKRWDGIEHFRKTQRNWGIWGVGSLVVWLGLLAAVVIPNIGRCPCGSPKEAAATELENIKTAVAALMVENNLSTIPHPVGTPTNDMETFPDVTSVAGSVDKAEDPDGNPYRSGDRNGYMLYGHDQSGDNDQTTLINYVVLYYTKGTYTVNAAGEVTQVTTGR